MNNHTLVAPSRIAKCGHSYATLPGTSGRDRKLCDTCKCETATAPKSCIRCAADMPQRIAGSGGRNRQYCSAKCRDSANRQRRVESGSYEASLAAKRDERSKKPLPVNVCIQCHATWSNKRQSGKFCSSRCHNKHKDAHNPVRCSEADCDRGVRAKGLCSMHWRRKARADGRELPDPWNDRRRATYHRRRAQKVTTAVEPIRPMDIYQRDMWICGLCSTPVNPDAVWPDSMSASLDHILPLSKGGSHTHENVQISHLVCNISKGNRVAA